MFSWLGDTKTPLARNEKKTIPHPKKAREEMPMREGN
jgi:hypothetical protein